VAAFARWLAGALARGAAAAAALLHGGAALLVALQLAWRLPCWACSTLWAGGGRAGRRWGAARRARCAAACALLPTCRTASGGAPPLLHPKTTFELHVRVVLMASAGRPSARACLGRVCVGRRRLRSGGGAALRCPHPRPSVLHTCAPIQHPLPPPGSRGRSCRVILRAVSGGRRRVAIAARSPPPHSSLRSPPHTPLPAACC